jgi:uncharacterized protein YggE
MGSGDKKMRTKYFLAGVFLAAVVFVLVCAKTTEAQSTVSVIGTGTVMAQPDTITMTVSLSETAQTTRRAQEAVSAMVGRTLDILKNSGIEDKNISTASLTFNSEYDYGSGMRVLVGQRAEQIITFSINDIQRNSDKVSVIIDELIQINGIELRDINFSVKDNTAYFVTSREFAFQKAVQKAEQYAELSGLKVKKVLSVSEADAQQFFPMQNKMVNQAQFEAAARDTASTIVPSGQLEISTTIQAVFLLE